MTRFLTLLVALAALAAPSAVSAQSARGSATLTVESPLTVAPTAPLRLKGQTSGEAPTVEGALALADAPTVVMVGGDPNRVYRVRIPNASAGDQQAVRIISDNAGDVSDSGVGRLDAQGRDRLHITGYNGALTEVQGRPTIPLSIVYE